MTWDILVHCLDLPQEPDKAFWETKERINPRYGGSLEYHQVDVEDTQRLEKVIADIAAQKQRLDRLLAGMLHFYTFYYPQ